MVENFGGSILYLLLFLIQLLGLSFYSYLVILNPKKIIDDYQVGEGAIAPIRLIGSFIVPLVLIGIYLLFTSIEGAWIYFILGLLTSLYQLFYDLGTRFGIIDKGYTVVNKSQDTIISIVFVRIYAKNKQENQGIQTPVLSISIGLLIILPLLSFLLGGVNASIEIPVIEQLSQTSFTYKGGLKLPPELISLALALSLYTATFIAECVRAGIQGIGKGQKEAAASIGLTSNQVLKLVVMPQALRIIIPPTTNQYLNLTKNSSLAAAIAYPDLVLVFAGTALMQTGRAIEIVSITMLTYLTLSITISIFMNWYNKKIAIKEK